jgi:protein involved in polysaccharide export with SLBB domain
MNKRLSYILFGSLLSILTGCVSISPLNPSDSTVSQTVAESKVEAKKDYLLQIGDVLEIKFYYDSKLNETVIIRPDGKISLQLIGELTASDQTPQDLNTLIQTKYGKFLKNPEVTVIVREFGGQKVYVGGEVMMPGVIPLKGNMTTLQAILIAGGFKETAHRGSIIVISRGPEDTSVTRKIDLRDVISGKADGEEVYVRPFDVIYVHKTLIAEVDKFVDQYIKKVIPVDLSAGFNYGIFKNKVPLL